MGLWYTRIREALESLLAEDSGQDLVEYAMVAVIIALGATASMGMIAKNINDVFTAVAKKIQSIQP